MKDFFIRTYRNKTDLELETIVNSTSKYEAVAREAALEILIERKGNSVELVEKAEIFEEEKRRLIAKNAKDFGNGDINTIDEFSPHFYSETVVLVSTVLLSSLVGGVLMYFNLLSINKKKEASWALVFGILSLALSILLNLFLPDQFSPLAYLINFLGMGIYSGYFWKVHIGKETAYIRKPWFLTVLTIVLAMVAFGFIAGIVLAMFIG